MPRRLILASASPRRRELLSLLGLPFTVLETNIHEPGFAEHQQARTDGSPKMYAEELALRKATDLFDRVRFGEIAAAETDTLVVLAADTVVLTEGQGPIAVLGKPFDDHEAHRMLRQLSSTSHTVLTALCLMEISWLAEHEEWYPLWKCRTVGTQVQFRELTDEMIASYVATGEPMDKAGAYGIQGGAAPFVEAVYGDYFNVVGLPVQTVGRMLEEVGIEWWRGPAALE